MMDVYNEEALVPSYPVSPKPRRQPMTSLSTNQRSYSRMNSKGVFGDESPLLLSPLPKYPNRRRSVTFADDTEATVREERPYYSLLEAGNASCRPLSESPCRRVTTKPSSKTNNGTNDTTAVNVIQCNDSATCASVLPVKALTPKRGRSNSRQRRVARRQQAELHHGFYDDSFVEEYVLKARKEIEGDEEKKRAEENRRQEERERAEAETKAAQTTVRLNALQQAKEYLLAAASVRCASPVCSSSERRDSRHASGQHHNLLKKEVTMLQQLDEEIDEIGEIIQQQQQQHQYQQRCHQEPRRAVKHSVPLVTHVDEVDEINSKKRPRQASRGKGCRSMPIVQGDDLDMDDDDDNGDEVDRDLENNMSKLKRAKLERIIARAIEQQANRRHGKRSVVVIDWDSDELLEDNDNKDEEEEDDKGEENRRQVAANVGAARSRRGQTSKKSSDLTTAPAAAAFTVPGAVRQQKPPSHARPVSSERAASARGRNAKSISVAPDLGEDSLLLEEEKPVLLRRPTTGRRPPTRSISNVSIEVEDDSIFDRAVDVSRKPPQRRSAPKTSRRGRKAPAVPAAAAASSLRPSVSPMASGHVFRSFTSVGHNLHANIDSPAETVNPPRRQNHRRVNSATSRQPPPVTSPDDPMAVFFGASFPSPSKFDEMMLAAGGLPETRRAGRGQARQPAILLPDSISRRR